MVETVQNFYVFSFWISIQRLKLRISQDWSLGPAIRLPLKLSLILALKMHIWYSCIFSKRFKLQLAIFLILCIPVVIWEKDKIVKWECCLLLNGKFSWIVKWELRF